jgi:hypothetical protein
MDISFMALSSTFSKLRDKLVDAWLTWQTKKSKEQREWESWYERNVVYRAGTIDNMFMHFKHVIIVNPDKFFDLCEPFTYVPNQDAKQYFWPQRELGNNAVWRFERVVWDRWTNSWHVNGMGDRDKVFVATNSDRDATMIALKYA